MVVAKVFKIAKRFQGLPKEDDFDLVEEEVAPPKDGEVLCKTIFLSVDPYMRVYTAKSPLGTTMIGEVLARVVESKDANFNAGDLVAAGEGWRSHFVVESKKLEKITHLPEGVPESLALGCLGMPGRTAYFGLLDVGELKSGETVLVNGAAGAVGSVVGQIAKIKGSRVVGYAGSDEKVGMLKEFGFDEAFNYKTVDLSETLSKAAPKKVDVYFDNVGGDFSDVVLSKHMNKYGRVPICGCISQYNKETPDSGAGFPVGQGLQLYGSILGRELKVQGFIVWTFNARKKEANEQLAQWVKEGKLKYRETVTEGFENTPKALIGLFTGANFGKAIVKV